MKYLALAWALITRARPIIRQAQELYGEVEKALADKQVSKAEMRTIFKEVRELLELLFYSKLK